MMRPKIIFTLVIFVYGVNCDDCNFHTCGECISSSQDLCVWCSKGQVLYAVHLLTDERGMANIITKLPGKRNRLALYYEGPLKLLADDKDGRRCISLTEVNLKGNVWCDGQYTNPKYTNDNTADSPFNETIQLRPQGLKIKTRPGIEHTISITYKPAKDYPLDVYYLIDISHTMIKQKEDLQHQAYKIYSELKSYTNNVRLGIGSFIEKPGFPLVNKNSHKIAHAFKNHLSLTDDVDRFNSMISKIEFGGNFDDPEAGLDALMQVMVCQKELEWRKDARRIIVLCTDSTYHSAGDGIIVGAIKQNDMQCHMENNLYNETLALTYDYPSTSQINKVASDEKFKIVFAAKEVVSTEYTLLAHEIIGAKYVALDGGKDAVRIIKDAYLENARQIKLYHNIPTTYIQLTLDQDCDTIPKRNCKSTPEKRIVTIEGKLTVKKCPSNIEERKQQLIIEAALLKDKITIDLEIDCECDCEAITSAVTKSPKCHNAGFIQCGICKCNPGSYGSDCQCNGTVSDTSDTTTCKRDPGDSKICSGHGKCRCGECQDCDKGFSGDFCEFDDETACPRKNTLMCSHNGICRRGKCDCFSLWTGTDCSCPMENTACITPYSKKVCSGQGVCKCGHCECDKIPNTDVNYTGIYCDMCDDCSGNLCGTLASYVLCIFTNNKTYCDLQNKTTDTIVYFLNLTQMHGTYWNMAPYCKTKLENSSLIIFKYKYDNGNLEIGIQSELELEPQANIFITVGAALGAVLLVGIITLIVWKILIDYHDKKEYEHFAKESKANGFEVYCNDLYQPPGSTFRNPAFESS